MWHSEILFDQIKFTLFCNTIHFKNTYVFCVPATFNQDRKNPEDKIQETNNPRTTLYGKEIII